MFGYAALWTLNLAIVGMMSAPGLGWAQPAHEDARIAFSIPAQPLISAISRYGEATGNEVVYDANLAIGRRSSDVQGLLTPAEALERLLAGTGLSARFVAESMFVVLPAQAAADQSVPPGPSPSAANSRYYALMQDNLLDALCRSNGARPGRYRIIVVFSIGSSGAIEQARRIGSTGEAGVDRQFDAALSSVRFSETPPEDFAQPVRILIVPDAPGVTRGCAGADARLRARRGPRWATVP
ncbi:STN domain-containing protein [Bradyrhizobium sp. Arg237L]|uniref:STN domain-containing protein n=1 Tax=Bradyrhizobium sp. Arg237L TaxID=3003352 RepID=UPI00249DAF96|nr:STN domain-containing protein [Bradyrhizobium sp. Arg237L]MDI4236519.1 STN domain-containing protein [Bradyrhizobium sp. Arg237L]